jgi:hypothetical protein
VRRAERSDGTAWLPGRRLAALRCLVAGHRWISSPVVTGAVVAMCEVCVETVVAAFVDEPEVLGLPVPAGRSLLGTSTTGRVVIDLVAAVLDGDEDARRRLRREAVARPGASVDALVLVGGYLSGMVDHDRPLAALQALAGRAEMDALDHEIEARG